MKTISTNERPLSLRAIGGGLAGATLGIGVGYLIYGWLNPYSRPGMIGSGNSRARPVQHRPPVHRGRCCRRLAAGQATRSPVRVESVGREREAASATRSSDHEPLFVPAELGQIRDEHRSKHRQCQR